MKSKIAIFSTLLGMLGAFSANASDCIGDGCDIWPFYQETVSRAEAVGNPTVPPTFFETTQDPADCIDCAHFAGNPGDNFWMRRPEMKSINVLSVKPVAADDRRALWDGVIGKYDQPKFDKTVDWRDGVPLWDDSVSHYDKKDFSDWFLEPNDVYFADELDQNIRAEVEELLAPMKPKYNLWANKGDKYKEQDFSVAIEKNFDNVKIIENGDGCPFETDAECAIWRRKPMVRETVSPRSPKIRAEKMNDFICAARSDNRIAANAAAAAPLLERYKMLMQSARACCTDGMAYQLNQAGATEGLVYKFLADDANFYGLGSRCLMMTDEDFDNKYPNTATAAVAADVRNGCLCRGRQWFMAMLAPFEDAYKAVPEFAKEKFNYTYIDGLQREVTVSVNNDVKNVLSQMALCP
ncbi:MAG: hypothetical protein LBF28_01760 [Rickettsiales bacterium]|jgi:hypothetical protein|nr:hypothetical protein [Rickettsiales bacterium]